MVVAKMENSLPMRQDKMPDVCWEVGGRFNAGVFTGSAHPLVWDSVVIGANGYLLLGILCLIEAYFKFLC